jgi:hypothetical protein
MEFGKTGFAWNATLSICRASDVFFLGLNQLPLNLVFLELDFYVMTAGVCVCGLFGVLGGE